MNLLDQLVAQALKNRPELGSLQAVLEKELLHHDILREMSAAGLLADLTFIGGTCLRTCYGAERLSEDLDFSGGADFRRESLQTLGPALVAGLEAKYGLRVTVEEPTREKGNVDTWKLTIITRPQSPGLPAQRINIDVCAIPSHDRRPMMLRNHYGVDMGTASLIIQAQSREEILADKLLALALRPNRLKNRDLWDIGWLKRQGVELSPRLVAQKIADRRLSQADFQEELRQRCATLTADPAIKADFIREMQRFLPLETARNTIGQENFWQYLTSLIHDECTQLAGQLNAGPPPGVS